MDEVLDVEVTADGQGKHDHPGLFEIKKTKKQIEHTKQNLVFLIPCRF